MTLQPHHELAKTLTNHAKEGLLRVSCFPDGVLTFHPAASAHSDEFLKILKKDRTPPNKTQPPRTVPELAHQLLRIFQNGSKTAFSHAELERQPEINLLTQRFGNFDKAHVRIDLRHDPELAKTLFKALRAQRIDGLMRSNNYVGSRVETDCNVAE